MTHPAIQLFYTSYERMLSLGSRIAGRHFTPGELTKQIRRQFPVTDFVFNTNKDYAVDPDMVIASGLYDCYNEAEMLPSIEITLSYHPDQKFYFVDILDWSKLSFDIAECIGHETVHQYQHHNRKLTGATTDTWYNNEREYLSDSDEIDAYAFSIAIESRVFNKPVTETTVYGDYQNLFDSTDEILLELTKRISYYQEQLELLDEQNY